MDKNLHCDSCESLVLYNKTFNCGFLTFFGESGIRSRLSFQKRNILQKNKILAEFGVPVDELPGGVITMHYVMFSYMLLYIFFLNSHKRRLSDGFRAVAFSTVSLKIRRLSDGVFCRSFDTYGIIRRLSDASRCRFCDVFS